MENELIDKEIELLELSINQVISEMLDNENKYKEEKKVLIEDLQGYQKKLDKLKLDKNISRVCVDLQR